MRTIIYGIVLSVGLTTTGCSSQTGAGDLQQVFGPRGVTFEERSFAIDLNADGQPERLLLLFDTRRGLEVPRDVSALIGGVAVDGFAVFDGRQPNVPVIYQYPDYDGYTIRLDDVEGERVLVSDGGRDHVQHVWGWWREPEGWPAAGWRAKSRAWVVDRNTWGGWRSGPLVLVNVGK